MSLTCGHPFHLEQHRFFYCSATEDATKSGKLPFESKLTPILVSIVYVKIDEDTDAADRSSSVCGIILRWKFITNQCEIIYSVCSISNIDNFTNLNFISLSVFSSANIFIVLRCYDTSFWHSVRETQFSYRGKRRVATVPSTWTKMSTSDAIVAGNISKNDGIPVFPKSCKTTPKLELSCLFLDFCKWQTCYFIGHK